MRFPGGGIPGGGIPLRVKLLLGEIYGRDPDSLKRVLALSEKVIP
jgi:hypothetical protein